MTSLDESVAMLIHMSHVVTLAMPCLCCESWVFVCVFLKGACAPC